MNVSKVAIAISAVLLLSACGSDSQEAEDRETDVSTPTAPIDTDNDGIADTEDTDDDNDGYEDDKDNEPLKPLVIPTTLNACITSLPDYPTANGATALDRPQSRLYDIARVNAITSEPYIYSQSEIVVGERTGLPNGLLADKNIEITQITTADPSASVDQWNPSFEHSYIDADSRQYIGNQDVFSRWWATNVDTNIPADLTLNEVTSYWVDRIDRYAPQQPNRQSDLTKTYRGKDIIQTATGLREVCVVEATATLDLIDNTGDTAVSVLHVIEDEKSYIDANHVVQLSERSYLEYDPADLENPTWGYTDYRKELVGLIEDELLYGRDPVTDRVPEGEFSTMEQCLASLPDSDYVSSPNESIEYIMSRYNAETGGAQDAIYTTVANTGEGVSWKGHENLNTSQLHGAFFDYQNPSALPFYEFTETYYESDEGLMVGFEATENGGNYIAWGSETLSSSLLSATGSYLMPEVRLNHVKPLNATAERASFIQVVNDVFAGKGTAWDSESGSEIPACKHYRRWEAAFYQEDGTVALDGDGNPITEFFDETNYYDNRGLIHRLRSSDSWSYEDWMRMLIKTN
ncbi:hypothetical protein [Photobacterium minamisatsumaniensis]|uniref:hypothetical protein n=1 Tax=Photobacterium minamisatsumaniensis TaxID=2910233 RepID=UPI003D0C75D2